MFPTCNRIPFDILDDEEHAFQLVEYKKEKTADDSRSLCSNDSDFDDYDDRIGTYTQQLR